jgi:hypothetical protein
MGEHFQIWPPRPRASSSAPAEGRAGLVMDQEQVKSAAAEFCARETPFLPVNIIKVAELRDDGSDAGQVTKDNAWRHPSTHPVILLTMVLDKYGDESAEWAPSVLRKTLQRDGITLSNSAWTKIMAVRAVVSSPSPWRQWEVFHWIGQGLSGLSPNFHYLEEPAIGNHMLAMDVMNMLDPHSETSEEVDKYIAATAKSDGLAWVPAPLEFIQHEIEDPQLLCSNCDAEHDDDNDVTCVTCHKIGTLSAIPYEFADLRDATKALYTGRIGLDPDDMLEDLPDSSAGTGAGILLENGRYAMRRKAALATQYRRLF